MNAIAFLQGSAFNEFAETDQQIGLRKANQFIQYILPRYGIHAFGGSLQEAAAHQAGHAIIYAAEGLHVSSVSISEIEVPAGLWGSVLFNSGWTECHQRPELTPDSPLADNQQYLRQTLAGWAGEIFALSGAKVRIASSLDERIAAVMLAERISERTNRSIENVLANQYAIIHATLRENKRLHQKLTKLLRRKLTLSEDQLSSILTDVKPLATPNPSDFRQAMDVATMLFLISRL